MITLEIPTVSDGFLDKVEFETNLPEEYKLSGFTVAENANYNEHRRSRRYVETLFDIGCLTISVAEFAASPSLWKGFNVVMDGLSVALPGVPSVSGVSRMIKSSDKLADALKLGWLDMMI